ncbi:hypothetical protein GOV12_06805 [Candidatus Pacearchaeota archaeon]|nr:hypothetical protein [Candidatus Pacearchaeota archaeon]
MKKSKMVFEFLQEASLFQMLPGGGIDGTNALAGFGAAMIGMMFVFMVIFIAIYFYLAIACSRIGSRAGVQNPNLSWLCPPIATVFDVAKAHYWPFPVMIIGYALGYLLIAGGMLTPALMILGGLIYGAGLLIFVIMAFFVWHYKTFVAIGRKGWQGILGQLISVIGGVFMLLGAVMIALSPALAGIIVVLGTILCFVGFIIYLIMMGIAAWGQSGIVSTTPSKMQVTTRPVSKSPVKNPGKMQVRARRA